MLRLNTDLNNLMLKDILNPYERVSMKLRRGFVSNSSSSSFIIRNLTNKNLSLIDFIKENKHLIKEFNSEYSDKVTLQDMLNSAVSEDSKDYFKPGDNNCVFGDESGTTHGRVYDYILRSGGSSKNFSWKFDEYLR